MGGPKSACIRILRGGGTLLESTKNHQNSPKILRGGAVGRRLLLQRQVPESFFTPCRFADLHCIVKFSCRFSAGGRRWPKIPFFNIFPVESPGDLSPNPADWLQILQIFPIFWGFPGDLSPNPADSADLQIYVVFWGILTDWLQILQIFPFVPWTSPLKKWPGHLLGGHFLQTQSPINF